LFYNQSEIDELRNMILVHHSPQHLFDLYKNEIRNKFAITTIPDNESPHAHNMEAALSYAIEPTSEKANAIRSSLLSFMRAFPDGLPKWWAVGCHECGYSVSWMFDLIQAYNPEKLSAVEKANLKQWFALSVERSKFDSRDSFAISGGEDKRETWVAPVTRREGKTMVSFVNWYSRYMGHALACALV